MEFDRLVKLYTEEQLEFDFEKKKAPSDPMILAKEDEEPRTFRIIWDGNTYETVAKSKDAAIGNIAYRLTRGSTKPMGVMRNEMKNCKVRDLKWNAKY